MPGPLGARHPTITPFQAFKTKDGALIIAAGNDSLFVKMCDALGLSGLASTTRRAAARASRVGPCASASTSARCERTRATSR